MRPPSDRMQRDTMDLLRRRAAGTTSRGEAIIAFADPVDFRGSFQALGDTGRRMDRVEYQNRMGGEDSWRVWIKTEDMLEADGVLVSPWCKTGDQIRYAGRKYICRSEPIPQRRTHEGEVLSWSVDVDGVI